MTGIFKFIILLILFSCSTNEKKIAVIQENDKEIFEKGIQYIEEKKFKESINQFIKINDEFPFSKYSSHSQIYNAYLNFELNKPDKTILILNDYISLNPDGVFTEYAKYLIAMCYYVKVSDPNRDSKFTKIAIEKFNKIIKMNPNSKYAKDAKFKLEYLRNYLARKEFEVGMFYLKNNAPSPALKRFSIIISDYQGSSIIPQTLYRMYEAFEILNLNNKSEQTYSILKYNFPKSKWTKEITNRKMNKVEEPGYFKNIMNKMISIF
tara:strand:- start:1 stop:795 length:795 start_codon:yes stop_codon:yes gene_type:complete